MSVSSKSRLLLSHGCFQVDWLHRPLLHGGPGPGLQLPGPAVRHAGLRQARLPDHAGLHLQHGRNHVDGVSVSGATATASVSALSLTASTRVLNSGVGFSFIFSWVLMGVVTVIFLVGGNVEKIFCEPYHTKDVFKASQGEGHAATNISGTSTL